MIAFTKNRQDKSGRLSGVLANGMERTAWSAFLLPPGWQEGCVFFFYWGGSQIVFSSWREGEVGERGGMSANERSVAELSFIQTTSPPLFFMSWVRRGGNTRWFTVFFLAPF